MENLKEEVVNLFCEYRAFECGSDMQLENKAQELTDKLIFIFDRERKRYALEMAEETIENAIDNYVGEGIDMWQFIPSQLQPGDENEK